MVEPKCVAVDQQKKSACREGAMGGGTDRQHHTEHRRSSKMQSTYVKLYLYINSLKVAGTCDNLMFCSGNHRVIILHTVQMGNGNFSRCELSGNREWYMHLYKHELFAVWLIKFVVLYKYLPSQG